MDITKDLTIIVPTESDEESIDKLLFLLYSIPKQMNLIIVNYSDAPITERMEKLINKNSPENCVLIHSEGTITQAREKGAEIAKTAWVLFTNPDIVFDKDYFNELKKYKEEDLRHQLIYGVKVSDQKLSKYYNLLKCTQNILRLFGLPKGTEANILVNRNAFLRVEGFDFVSNHKDSEIIWKLKRWGYKILFNPRLAVYCQNMDYNLS